MIQRPVAYLLAYDVEDQRCVCGRMRGRSDKQLLVI